MCARTHVLQSISSVTKRGSNGNGWKGEMAKRRDERSIVCSAPMRGRRCTHKERSRNPLVSSRARDYGRTKIDEDPRRSVMRTYTASLKPLVNATTRRPRVRIRVHLFFYALEEIDGERRREKSNFSTMIKLHDGKMNLIAAL